MIMTNPASPSIDRDSAYASRIARMVYELQNSHPNSRSLPLAPQPPTSLKSTAGIPALLALELAAEKTRLDNDEKYFSRKQEVNHLLGEELPTPQDLLTQHEKQLTASMGEIADYLNYNEEDICAAAKRLALFDLDVEHKIAHAENLLGAFVPGETVIAQLLRVNDPRFWRRALRVRIMRAREQFFLRHQVEARH